MRWTKILDTRAFLVFQRIQRFYSTFTVLSALVSGLAVGVLTFPEFHPSSARIRVAEGLLCSSAITAVLAAVFATMLLFAFEGVERATRTHLAIAWSPLVFLDLSVVEFLGGLVCWYYGHNVLWRGALMATQLAVLLGLVIAVTVWMGFHLSREGSLGVEEREAVASGGRVANK